MIRTENLTRRFDGLVAVRDLNLRVEPGEVFGFLGPNGAGKTTTVRMLAGLIQPSEGHARVAGCAVGADNQAIRQRVGVLTETPGLYEKLSAYQNLEFYARLYGVADVAGKIEKHLSLLGLWARRADPVGQFSKGMRQKVAIARALLHDPAVLFLDEPTSGLDPEAARTVRAFIAELSRAEGRTVFLCTHNLHEAERLCDRIGLMKQSLVRVGTPDELKRALFEPQTVFELGRTPERVEELLALPFVRRVEVEDGCLVVTLDDPDSQNPTLIERLVAGGAQVRYVRERARSLEDVYLTLLGGEADEPQTAVGADPEGVA